MTTKKTIFPIIVYIAYILFSLGLNLSLQNYYIMASHPSYGTDFLEEFKVIRLIQFTFTIGTVLYLWFSFYSKNGKRVINYSIIIIGILGILSANAILLDLQDFFFFRFIFRITTFGGFRGYLSQAFTYSLFSSLINLIRK